MVKSYSCLEDFDSGWLQAEASREMQSIHNSMVEEKEHSSEAAQVLSLVMAP